MTSLSQRFPPLAELNGSAFANSKLRVVNEDAMTWLERSEEMFDVAIVDFPDPNHFALGKLYTKRFYRLLKNRLTPDAAVAVQCTSPFFAPRSYWCIVRTMEAAGLAVQPYHAAVPSFGVWGFALAMNRTFDPPRQAPRDLRFLDDAALAAMFQLSADLQPVPVEINRLDNQVLVRYYETEWQRWNN
jgi:spermidine synthase